MLLPTVSEAKEFYRRKPIVLAEKLQTNVMGTMKVPTEHKSLGAERGSTKHWGATTFQAPLVALSLQSVS